MNKTAIKNFAIWARQELMARVAQKAYTYGVTETELPAQNTDAVNGRLLSNDEKNALNELVRQIQMHTYKEKKGKKEVEVSGFTHVIEEVAYTWFNRFIALRYMEVNNFLPQRIRVFTNENNEFKPEILTDAIHVELEGLDQQKVFEYIEQANDEDLYKYLLQAICSDMHQYLPEMFTSISDYKVLLFPDNLLDENSVIGRMISDIPEEDWKDQVQIIGWLYQYYISEKHNEVINILKGTVKKEDIPAATGLWTTDWVVRYMVDNSLGRYWIERNPDSELKNKLEFLATAKDGSIPTVDDKKNPEELTFFDPCMGSGHILVYAFDVLMEIYKECGYSERDAAKLIIENNLFGLDIDERSFQLAYFAVMMKARSYNRRIMTLNVKTNISHIIETNNVESLFFEGMNETEKVKEIAQYLLDSFKNALELGSLIEVEEKDYDNFLSFIDEIHKTATISFDSIDWMNSTYYEIQKLVKQAKILSRKYTITTTNPPYLSKMEGNLKKYVVKHYKDCSSDLFAVFIKRNFKFTEEDGYLGFMTPFVWMFIKSYEKLRTYILKNKSIATLVQMEYSAYEEATVPICSFVLKNKKDNNLGYYFRLSDFKGGMEVQKQKVLEAISNKDCGYYYESDSNNFSRIPGNPIAYWVSQTLINDFEKGEILKKRGDTRQGMATSDNKRFLRLWHEVSFNKVGLYCVNADDALAKKCKWYPYNKGGEFRKWYGNIDYLINYEKDGFEVKKYAKSLYKSVTRTIKSISEYFKPCISWSKISSGAIAFRYYPKGFIFDVAGCCIFYKEYPDMLYDFGFLNSVVSKSILSALSPTLNYEAGHIATLPILRSYTYYNAIGNIANVNIQISKTDWDSFETSWDFTVHPLVKNSVSTVSEAYSLWSKECDERFNQLKLNEEELNRIFIDIYGLQDELDPYVEDKDVTVHYVVDSKEDIPESLKNSNYVHTKQDEIKSFISYAVGCMFGRYSLDVEGLVYAGGEFDWSKYSTFIPDKDDILPICDDEYFEDDIVGRFIEFVRVLYGSETLEENLAFIAEALGGKGTPREILRNYFLNEFFKDHCNTYQVSGSGKRPIYWLFDSGRKNGFKALVYIHRYKPDLIARMRTEYIHPLQAKYRTQMDMLHTQMDSATSTSENVKLNKKLKKIQGQASELSIYEEKIHHWADKMEPMDLDDGVKANYAKFQELLAKIK